MHEREALITAELNRRCPPGWSAIVEEPIEITLDDAYADSMDAYLQGQADPLRDLYASLLPDREPSRRAVAQQIAQTAGITSHSDTERIFMMVAERDRLDPLEEGGVDLMPEVLRLEVGWVTPAEWLCAADGDPLFSCIAAREVELRMILQEALLWHPRMEFHVRNLAVSDCWGSEWGRRIRLDLRFAAIPESVRAPADGELWDWLLVLTGEQGQQVTSEFDPHGDHQAESFKQIFHASRPARLDRGAWMPGHLEAWEYPSVVGLPG